MHWRVAVAIYAIVLFFLNFIRIFDNNFWFDEAFTANIVRNTVSGMVSETAADVHPPLYYLFVKAAYTLLGNQGWAFHSVSLVPCAIMLILSLTVFWDRFGKEMSVLFITLVCLSPNAVLYNVEVRMYSWGALFVLLSFYGLYGILEREGTRDYVMLVVFSIAAAYTHYYCLVSVAFFYVVLLAVAFRRKHWGKAIISCICVVAGYLPWFSVMLETVLDRVDDYWITDIPTFMQSMEYLFSGRFKQEAWVLPAGGLVVVFLYESGILAVKKDKSGTYKVTLSMEGIKFSGTLVWLFAGVASVLGTICFAIGISVIIRPFYVLRYIYPVSVVAWMVLCVVVSRLKGKKIYTALLLAYMLIAFFPEYSTRFVNEKKSNELLQVTLMATANEIDIHDVILTDRIPIPVAQYYYPDVPLQWVDLSSLPQLEADKRYWLMAEKESDTIYQQTEGQGFSCEKLVDRGKLGTYTVSIYRIEKQKGREEED